MSFWLDIYHYGERIDIQPILWLSGDPQGHHWNSQATLLTQLNVSEGYKTYRLQIGGAMTTAIPAPIATGGRVHMPLQETIRVAEGADLIIFAAAYVDGNVLTATPEQVNASNTYTHVLRVVFGEREDLE